jgi:hypothetical protein
MREHQRPAFESGRNMFRLKFLQLTFLCMAQLINGPTTPPPQAPPPSDAPVTALDKIPPNTIIVKGAEPSASDRSTPVPEGGAVSKNIYNNRYLGINLPLPSDWTEAYKGPPPSDSGSYVLAQLIPAASFKGPVKGTVLISAQDMFFALNPAHNAMEMITFSRDHLPSYYEVERPPTPLTIAGRSFVRFDYKSPVAGLHWYVLATQIRCHTVQFVFTSQDTKMLEGLIENMNRMQAPAGTSPVCIANYAVPANIVSKVDPILTDHRFNAVPVRIIIDKNGRVQHVHVISAFPDQAQIITDALMQWTFKPKEVEVETGIMFRSANTASRTTLSTND